MYLGQIRIIKLAVSWDIVKDLFKNSFLTEVNVRAKKSIENKEIVRLSFPSLWDSPQFKFLFQEILALLQILLDLHVHVKRLLKNSLDFFIGHFMLHQINIHENIVLRLPIIFVSSVQLWTSEGILKRETKLAEVCLSMLW